MFDPNGFDPASVDGMTEEQLREVLYPYQDQQALLEQQMAQAQALRTNYGQGRSSGLAAGLGSLADVVNAYSSGKQQKQVGEDQQALLGRKQESAVGFHGLMQQQARAYADALRRGRPAQDSAQALSFGLPSLTLGGG